MAFATIIMRELTYNFLLCSCAIMDSGDASFIKDLGNDPFCFLKCLEISLVKPSWASSFLCEKIQFPGEG